MFKRIATLTLVLAILFTSTISVSASTGGGTGGVQALDPDNMAGTGTGSSTTSGSTVTSPATVTQDQTTFSVTVPSVMPITLDNAGNVTVANNLTIVNNGSGPVKVTDVQVAPLNGWSLVPFNTDFKHSKVGLKQFSLKLNTEEVGTDGKIAKSDTNWPDIVGKGQMAVSYSAKVAAQKTAQNISIANVVFTVAWSEAGTGTTTTPEQYFTIDNGTITDYTGPMTDVVVPATVNGQVVTQIGDYSFSQTGITSIELPNTVFSIGIMAFDGDDITRIKLPAGVYVDQYALSDTGFYDCYQAEGQTAGTYIFNPDAWEWTLQP